VTGTPSVMASDASMADILDPMDPRVASSFVLKRRSDAPPIGSELDALVEFRAAAVRVKAADVEFRAAQQAYTDAIKRLSEEATK